MMTLKKIEMKSWRLLLVILASLLLISCGGESGSSADKALGTDGVRDRGLPMVAAETTKEQAAVNPKGITWGRIYKSNDWTKDTSEGFREKLIDFLSPQLKSEDVGEVSGDIENVETGIQFWGRGIVLKTGLDFSTVERPLFTEDVFKEETAELRISIIQKNPKAEGFEEIPIHFNSGLKESKGRLISSKREGQFIQLVFADSFGKVALSGQIEDVGGRAYFRGQLIYRNLKDINGAPVNQEGRLLGEFKVEACGFFKCSNKVL